MQINKDAPIWVYEYGLQGNVKDLFEKVQEHLKTRHAFSKPQAVQATEEVPSESAKSGAEASRKELK